MDFAHITLTLSLLEPKNALAANKKIYRVELYCIVIYVLKLLLFLSCCDVGGLGGERIPLFRVDYKEAELSRES